MGKCDFNKLTKSFKAIFSSLNNLQVTSKLQLSINDQNEVRTSLVNVKQKMKTVKYYFGILKQLNIPRYFLHDVERFFNTNIGNIKIENAEDFRFISINSIEVFTNALRGIVDIILVVINKLYRLAIPKHNITPKNVIQALNKSNYKNKNISKIINFHLNINHSHWFYILTRVRNECVHNNGFDIAQLILPTNLTLNPITSVGVIKFEINTEYFLPSYCGNRDLIPCFEYIFAECSNFIVNVLNEINVDIFKLKHQ